MTSSRSADTYVHPGLDSVPVTASSNVTSVLLLVPSIAEMAAKRWCSVREGVLVSREFKDAAQYRQNVGSIHEITELNSHCCAVLVF